MFVIYAFISCKWEETPRSKISRNVWIIGSAIWVLALTYTGTLKYIIGYEQHQDLLPMLFFFIPLDIGFAFLLINNIFYPESVLFTHEQIGRALKIYPTLEESIEKRPKDRGIKLMKQYLDLIPEELRLKIADSNL